MEKAWIVAVDQSTSGTKALLLDRQGGVCAKHSLEHRQFYPQPGWAEHDPLEIYGNVVASIRGVLREAGVAPSQLAAITITNQRETAVVWDGETGEPVYHAIVWQCRRTAAFCDELKRGGHERTVQEKTGLVIDPYFSASKFRWILDHAAKSGDKADQRAGRRLLAGTIDSWLIWKLTGGAVHATDYSNASRTSLFNIHTLQWDPALIGLFGLAGVELPQVRSSDAVFGYTADSSLFAERVPIAGVIGDSQAALFAQRCHRPGMAKATYGTGTSVMMNTGRYPASAGNGLVATIAWGSGGTVDYALEGIIHSTGDCVKWVRDQLGLFGDYAEAESQAVELADNEGVYLVPAFVGLGAPYWAPNARAALLGMSRRTGRRHIIRAAFESIAYQVRETMELMAAEAGVPLRELRVDGGATANRFVMQFQADMLQTPLVQGAVPELSAIGAAMLGGLGVGFWSDPKQLAELFPNGCEFRPAMEQTASDKYFAGWKKAVQAVIG
ncbi:FGGY family carbohydrate kinase [Paenibacillus thalictri]|uniref:ATP:glycerol 3-phosphotransferase n=1 Tax=Paenibacillus thalictri TaxID=2527873 RepID=A0A4Q9DKH3_9BACL|nr:glycerol kinase [Paenibacillus thalictri]TBL74536.1 glycerol kinase [Paenibacillus thalictri]